MRWVIAAALMLCATPAWAWSYAFEDDGISGSVWTEHELLATECTMVVDRPPQDVAAVLANHRNVGRWLPDTVDFQVVDVGGGVQRFRRTINTPFFAPDLWLTIDSTTTSAPGDVTRVDWHRVEGSIARFDASWEVRPHPRGSQVTYRVKTSPPTMAPQFILERMASRAIVKTLQALRKEIHRKPISVPPAAP